MTNTLPLKVLGETAAASSNFLVLLRALQSPQSLAELERYEPPASPYLKGRQAQQDLLGQAGGLMTSDEVESMLNLTRQAVDKDVSPGSSSQFLTGNVVLVIQSVNLINTALCPVLIKC